SRFLRLHYLRTPCSPRLFATVSRNHESVIRASLPRLLPWRVLPFCGSLHQFAPICGVCSCFNVYRLKFTPCVEARRNGPIIGRWSNTGYSYSHPEFGKKKSI